MTKCKTQMAHLSVIARSPDLWGRRSNPAGQCRLPRQALMALGAQLAMTDDREEGFGIEAFGFQLSFGL